MVGGEAGAGKTRLITEFARTVHRRGGVVMHGGCTEHGELPFQPFVEAIDQALTTMPDAERARLAAVSSSELVWLLPSLRGRDDPSGVLAVDPDAHRYRLFESVVDLLADLGQQTPVLALPRRPALGPPADARAPRPPVALDPPAPAVRAGVLPQHARRRERVAARRSSRPPPPAGRRSPQPHRLRPRRRAALPGGDGRPQRRARPRAGRRSPRAPHRRQRLPARRAVAPPRGVRPPRAARRALDGDRAAPSASTRPRPCARWWAAASPASRRRPAACWSWPPSPAPPSTSASWRAPPAPTWPPCSTASPPRWRPASSTTPAPTASASVTPSCASRWSIRWLRAPAAVTTWPSARPSRRSTAWRSTSSPTTSSPPCRSRSAELAVGYARLAAASALRSSAYENATAVIASVLPLVAVPPDGGPTSSSTGPRPRCAAATPAASIDDCGEAAALARRAGDHERLIRAALVMQEAAWRGNDQGARAVALLEEALTLPADDVDPRAAPGRAEHGAVVLGPRRGDSGGGGTGRRRRPGDRRPRPRAADAPLAPVPAVDARDPRRPRPSTAATAWPWPRSSATTSPCCTP